MIKVEDYLKVTNYKEYIIKEYFYSYDCGDYEDKGLLTRKIVENNYGKYIVKNIHKAIVSGTEIVNGEVKYVISVIPILLVKKAGINKIFSIRKE